MARKSDIVDALSQVEGLSRRQAGEAFDVIFDTITAGLADGDRVQIPGFGTFSVSRRAERQGRNPQTGEAITIKASNVARFKAGKGLKDAINA